MSGLIRLIEKKRKGETHTEEEIAALIFGLMNGELADCQMSAWLMAACINGLNLEEATWLTEAYINSGTCLNWKNLAPAIVADKHSTGGVGDKTTLVVVPLLAAAGLKVAKLSGRGLGFTGGTIDKLEAIPGFNVSLTEAAFEQQLKEVGAAISSQTAELAPADGVVYALRDITATVDDVALIAASVVSKKIAAGANVIVLDVKYGTGAFMKTKEEAEELAFWCKTIGERLGRKLETVLSPMEEPLGFAVGNALEVMEAVDTLRGKGPEDLESVCLELASVALVKAGLAATETQAQEKLLALLRNGKAFAMFEAMVKAQGGDVLALHAFERLPQPLAHMEVKALESGRVTKVCPVAIAKAVQYLGGGRFTKTDVLNYGVGVVLAVKVGAWVNAGDRLAMLHIGEVGLKDALEQVQAAFVLDPVG